MTDQWGLINKFYSDPWLVSRYTNTTTFQNEALRLDFVFPVANKLVHRTVIVTLVPETSDNSRILISGLKKDGPSLRVHMASDFGQKVKRAFY